VLRGYTDDVRNTVHVFRPLAQSPGNVDLLVGSQDSFPSPCRLPLWRAYGVFEGEDGIWRLL
jgi:hypothetical protein